MKEGHKIQFFIIWWEGIRMQASIVEEPCKGPPPIQWELLRGKGELCRNRSKVSNTFQYNEVRRNARGNAQTTKWGRMIMADCKRVKWVQHTNQIHGREKNGITFRPRGAT